jgi:hypothetical protein
MMDAEHEEALKYTKDDLERMLREGEPAELSKPPTAGVSMVAHNVRFESNQAGALLTAGVHSAVRITRGV